MILILLLVIIIIIIIFISAIAISYVDINDASMQENYIVKVYHLKIGKMLLMLHAGNMKYC